MKLSSTSKAILSKIAQDVRSAAVSAGRAAEYEQDLFVLNIPSEAAEIDQSWIDMFAKLTTTRPPFIGSNNPFREEVDFVLAEIRLKQKRAKATAWRTPATRKPQDGAQPPQ